MNVYLFEKELFIRSTARVFLKIYEFVYVLLFSFGFEGGMSDLIVLITDH